MEFEVKTIPGYCAYLAEVEEERYFSSMGPEDNIFVELITLLQEENPDVEVMDPSIPCAFIEVPTTEMPDGTKIVRYFEQVGNKGVDNKDGIYRFVDVPEILALTADVYGENEVLFSAFEEMFKWIEESEYQVAGPARVFGVHGEWDTEDEKDYENLVQIPIEKK